MDPSTAAELIPRFKIDKILNQDQGGRPLALLGTNDAQPTLLLIERSALPSTLPSAAALHAALAAIQTLGANDIYAWYMASHHGSTGTGTGPSAPPPPQSALSPPSNLDPARLDPAQQPGPGLKLSLIHPCSPKHVAKYSAQRLRVVTETPALYRARVAPFIARERSRAGRIDWLLNIVEGRAEQGDVIVRESSGEYPPGRDPEGFLLLPDMNWDRATAAGLRVLGLVERRDLWSLRDLRKRDVAWLRRVYARVRAAVAARYAGCLGVEEDMLKVYVHYQPTYYHFHLHVVSTELEPNSTQAVGKAFALPNLISWLEGLEGGEDRGLMDVEITYTIGEESELWQEVYGPLKEEEEEKKRKKKKDEEEAEGSTE